VAWGGKKGPTPVARRALRGRCKLGAAERGEGWQGWHGGEGRGGDTAVFGAAVARVADFHAPHVLLRSAVGLGRPYTES
jgi:hypothetical protein